MKSYLSVATHVSAVAKMGWVVQPIKQAWANYKLRSIKGRDLRKIERFRCQIDAALISERLARIEGRIKDMSIGGCLFRPASFYLVDRSSEDIRIEMGEVTLVGKVVRTLPIGYAVQFETLLDDDLFSEVLKLSSVEASTFNNSQEDEAKATAEKAQNAA